MRVLVVEDEARLAENIAAALREGAGYAVDVARNGQDAQCIARRVPYDAVYRGLASAIGLLLWMFLTAMIVLLGAAYNAEAREAVERGASLLTLQ